MKRFIPSAFFLFFSILSAQPLLAVKPALKLNECTETTVEKLFTRWPKDFYSDEDIEKYGVDWEDQTGIINFSNELTVYLYRNRKLSRRLNYKNAKNMYLNGDKTKVCLKFIPTECRKRVPDSRGEIYSITNQRTRKTHFGQYGRNQCGGA